MNKSTILFFSVIVIFFLFFGCKGRKTEKQDPLPYLKLPEDAFLLDIPDSLLILKFHSKDSILVTFDVYKPKQILYPVFDSIIEIVDNCPNPRKDWVEFKEGGELGLSVSIRRVYNKDEFLTLSIQTISMHLSNFEYYSGLIEYKDNVFFFDGIFLDEFLMKTNRKQTMKFVDPKTISLSHDSSDYNWNYAIKDTVLQATAFTDCNKSWTDWEFFDSFVFN